MRIVASVLLVVLLGAVNGCGRSTVTPEARQALAAEELNEGSPLVVGGKTQPAPGHVAKIAPTVLHPVTEVLVKVGDRVKKEQALVKIDDDEPQAEVRAKKAFVRELQAGLARLKEEPRLEEQKEAQAILESSRVSLEECRQMFARIEPFWRKGSIPDQRYHEARHHLAKSQAEEAAAAARVQRLLKRPFEREVAELEARIAAAAENVKAAEAELEHYTVIAQMAGVVTSLDVCPGVVARPGTTTWGEILDLSVIDIRCEVSPEQADMITVGQTAEILQKGGGTPPAGEVVWVSIAADPQSGRVPVLVRLNNPDNRLRCYVEVKVRFGAKGAGSR